MAGKKCSLPCCNTPPGVMERIAEDLAKRYPGFWAEKVSYGPACHCGLRSVSEPCPRHPGKEEADE